MVFVLSFVQCQRKITGAGRGKGAVLPDQGDGDVGDAGQRLLRGRGNPAQDVVEAGLAELDPAELGEGRERVDGVVRHEFRVFLAAGTVP